MRKLPERHDNGHLGAVAAPCVPLNHASTTAQTAFLHARSLGAGIRGILPYRRLHSQGFLARAYLEVAESMTRRETQPNIKLQRSALRAAAEFHVRPTRFGRPDLAAAPLFCRLSSSSTGDQ